MFNKKIIQFDQNIYNRTIKKERKKKDFIIFLLFLLCWHYLKKKQNCIKTQKRKEDCVYRNIPLVNHILRKKHSGFNI